ncbi:L7Ae/L30e/S12e/Gadd45 family ribosomal protein [Facklamia sp. P12945]|uniref:L7Ae/L30e/S12e/Gadd45 family ribosomal protein n=1 Tax=unclassified Facklamia TaxID=2622293 RepID=UPI003D186545
MSPEEKQLNLLGLAQRASKLISGDDLVTKATKNKKVKLLILAIDASDSTSDRYHRLASEKKIAINHRFTKYQISHAIGKSRTICGITDRGMAEKFLSYVTGENTMNNQ